MSFLTMYLNQTCTWWQKTGTDGFGNVTFATPRTLRCRWEESTRLITNAEGQQIPSRSHVWLEQDIRIGDWLFLGTSYEADPQSVDDAYIVQDFRKVPSLDATDFERLAYL